MSGSLNRVMLIGNLGADPEVRSFQSGGQVCNLRIATSESWKDREGQRQERVEWHSVSIFTEGLIKVCQNYLRKGSKVFVEGQLQTRKWTDQSGNDRFTTEVVVRGFGGSLIMLDGKPSREPDGSRGAGYGDDAGSFADEIDSDIPFITRAGVF